MGVQATIVDSDIRATNGIIHQIDKVLNNWLCFPMGPLNLLGPRRMKILTEDSYLIQVYQHATQSFPHSVICIFKF